MCSTTLSYLASPHISPYLPISPHISPYLPIPPRISRCSTTLSYLTNVDAKSDGSKLGGKAAGPTHDQASPNQVSEGPISISRQLDEARDLPPISHRSPSDLRSYSYPTVPVSHEGGPSH